MADGIGTVGASVPVTVTTKPQMLDLRTAFNDAETQFNTGRKTLRDAQRTAGGAEQALYTWLCAAKAVFVSHFGLRWSADWAAIGFVTASTAIPARIADRLALAGDIVTFLTANPSYENSSSNVTAAYGTAVIGTVTAAQEAVATAEQARDGFDTARKNARAAIITGMRGLVKNLETKLPASDPRWLAFGLQKPGTRVTPAKPTGLTVILTGSQTAQATCDPTPLATRYRFRMRQVGPGYTYELKASATAPLANIEVPPGTMLEIIVQAVNDNLQSVPSDPYFLTVPIADTPLEKATPAEAATADELAPLAAIQPNGNGKAKTNGNGKGHASRAING
ncbi:MAG TPA: hypothetical protein VGF73_12975 [Chthoniobacterales bacterium]